jgi:hypothetical protein
MGPPTSPEVQIEYVQHRRRRWQVAGALFALAVMLGVLAIFGVAYAQQANRVDELEDQNESILGDHHAIGEAFAKQSKRFEAESKELEAAIRSSYGQGFAAGQEAARLPRELRSLARYAAAGVLVPRRIPSGVGSRARVQRDLASYSVRWGRLALFASRTEPFSNWTRQALGGVRRQQVGRYRVQRMTGPTGVIYAWRSNGATYAVIVLPAYESAARSLIASMQ